MRTPSQVALATSATVHCEVLIQVYTPGVMEAGLGAPIFWYGMLLALTAGFLAAFPVNYFLVGKGIGHHH